MLNRLIVFVAVTLAGVDAQAETVLDTPSLVVVVSVDQWRYEYFERFTPHLSPTGIAKRTQSSGVWFDNCFHQHAFTFTGPGHSVLMTGAYPNRSGIIDNNWFDRSTGKTVYCVSDAEARVVGTTADEQPVSPRNLLIDTVGDQLKMASGFRSKVIGVAIKDRAAILMAGRLADAAYWMSKDGKWITSDHYRDSLPGYVRVLNEQREPFRFAGTEWTRLHSPSAYSHGEVERSDFELPPTGMSQNFPHAMPHADDENYINHLTCSPFGNAATLEIARQAVIHEQLGRDEHADILAINLSSTDYVGHAFGPYSLEVEDMTYRTDKQLGEFAQFLDEQLGDAAWTLLLTSDHGVAPIPERATQWGLPAKRNPYGEPDENGNYEKKRQYLEGALRAALGVNRGDAIVQAVLNNQVFLNLEHPALWGPNAELAMRITRNHFAREPFVAHAATREQLLGDGAGNEMLRLMQRSFHAQRSGDVLFVLKPYAFSNNAAAAHGSPWHYDRHVPLMIVGNRSKLDSSDRSQLQVSPAQIAPTIARLLRIETPSACTESSLKLNVRQ